MSEASVRGDQLELLHRQQRRQRRARLCLPGPGAGGPRRRRRRRLRLGRRQADGDSDGQDPGPPLASPARNTSHARRRRASRRQVAGVIDRPQPVLDLRWHRAAVPRAGSPRATTTRDWRHERHVGRHRHTRHRQERRHVHQIGQRHDLGALREHVRPQGPRHRCPDRGPHRRVPSGHSDLRRQPVRLRERRLPDAREGGRDPIRRHEPDHLSSRPPVNQGTRSAKWDRQAMRLDWPTCISRSGSTDEPPTRQTRWIASLASTVNP